jgi:hypothetical protein
MSGRRRGRRTGRNSWTHMADPICPPRPANDPRFLETACVLNRVLRHCPGTLRPIAIGSGLERLPYSCFTVTPSSWPSHKGLVPAAYFIPGRAG